MVVFVSPPSFSIPPPLPPYLPQLEMVLLPLERLTSQQELSTVSEEEEGRGRRRRRRRGGGEGGGGEGRGGGGGEVEDRKNF